MAGTVTYGSGTADGPWKRKTPSLSSEYLAWHDQSAKPQRLIVQVGTTKLSYLLRCIEDAYPMLQEHADWMVLGTPDEGKPVVSGPSRRGCGTNRIRSKASMGSERATGDASPTTFRRWWRYLAWLSLSTMPATTECEC